MPHLIIVEPLDIPAPEIPADDSLLFDWFEDWRAWVLYEKHLGDLQFVIEFWVSPAKQLGLSLLPFLDEWLQIAAPDKLEQLSKELDTLEAHWHTLTLPEWPPDFKESYLLKRMGFFREAIQVALERKGLLSVG